MRRTSGKEALQHAITAAELYMKAAKEASSPAEKTRFKRKCQDLISQAETLKAPRDGAPQQSRELTTAEKIILLKSSKLHGSVFPPWEQAPKQEAFERLASDDEPYT